MKTDATYIPRKLTWTDDEFKSWPIDDSHILESFSEPVVILGDPGMGKTWLMEKLSSQSECLFIRAVSLLRKKENPAGPWQRLVVDGLDEVAAIEEGDPLHNVLKKLVAFGTPPFVISCRSAEWQSVTGKMDIAEEYGKAPKILTLEPLSREDAIQALSCRIDGEKAQATIAQLDDSGLSNLYSNPLTLEFVAAALHRDGDIPRNRADLYQQAVGQLRLEHNTTYGKSRLAQLSEDDALRAAGTLMAVMLITGCDSISTVKHGVGAVAVADLSDIANQEDLNALLGSRLFRAEGLTSGQFRPLHRTVAEFLGAKWLADQVNKAGYPSRTAVRLLGLISAEGGVPASLRGLHAWLPKFSPTWLGPLAIDRDPYGVLLYGDGDNLSNDQAGRILKGLRNLAAFDPNFRKDWWQRPSFKGLAKIGLKDEIREILLDIEQPFDLRSLLLDAMIGSALATELSEELEIILFDPNWTYHERHGAATALKEAGNLAMDWSQAAERLIAMADEDSTRLALNLLDIAGFEVFSDKLVARAIVSDAGLLESAPTWHHRSQSTNLYFLARAIPVERVSGVLDALAVIISPSRDQDAWWLDGHHDWPSEFGGLVDSLILRQLEHDSEAVSPEQLWSWVRTLQAESYYRPDGREKIQDILREDIRLRRGVQRLALFGESREGHCWRRIWRLRSLGEGLDLTEEDARIYLTEIVERGDFVEIELWKDLVSFFRTSQGVPDDIKRLARSYAQGNKELLGWLSQKPKADEWERERRRRALAQKRNKEKAVARARGAYLLHIDEMRQGELKWIFDPARAYLGMFSDLDREHSPAERLAAWLGEELRDAALHGFEAVLHRDDIPTVKQIAESYAESKVWNFVFPMLAGAGRRMLEGRGFADLPGGLLSAVSIAAEHEIISPLEQFEGLKDALDAELRAEPVTYEEHVRQKYEPMLRAGCTHISGLYQFTRRDLERPLATRLSLEWLQSFEPLPLQVAHELADCILSTPEPERDAVLPCLKELAIKRAGIYAEDKERDIFWHSLLFLLDFDTAVCRLPEINAEHKSWLWPLTDGFYSRADRGAGRVTAAIAQLKWIVTKFRQHWPYSSRPGGVTSGRENAWDATELLNWALYQIAKDPSDQAAEALIELRDMPRDGYTDVAQGAIAAQHRARLEANFRSPPLNDLKAVILNSPPRTAADVQAIVLDELARLQVRLKGDPLNIVNNFYHDDGKPKKETDCCLQMLIALGQLPFGISFSPESAMPQGKRSDAVFGCDSIAVPLEAKGQWNKDLWTAGTNQLDRYYTIHHKAASKGIYLVFWFGAKAPAGKRLKPPPEDTPHPNNPEELRWALEAKLPPHRRGDIAIVVLDLTRQ